MPAARLSPQPSTPCASAERAPAPELSTTGSLAGSSTALSWSLWDQSSCGSSFYEQLQAAASDGFPGASRTSSSQLPSPVPGGIAPQHLTPVPAAPVQAPFPGLAPHGMGLSLGFAPPGPPHASRASMDAEHEMQQLLAAVASMATQDG